MTEAREAVEAYLRHRVDLIRFATALVGPSDAADVVSEAMLSLLNGAGFHHAESPVALMYRAVTAKARSSPGKGLRLPHLLGRPAPGGRG